MVLGTAAEPFQIEDTPSPPQSPGANAEFSQQVWVIDDSDEEEDDDDDDLPSSSAGQPPPSAPRLASRAPTQYWRLDERKERPYAQPESFKVESSGVRKPLTSPNVTPRGSPNILPSLPFTKTPTYNSERSGSPQRRAKTPTPSPSAGEHASSVAPLQSSSSPLTPIPSVDFTDEDIIMEDQELGAEEDVTHHSNTQIEQEQIVSGDLMDFEDRVVPEVAQDNQAREGQVQESQLSTVGTESPLVERMKIAKDRYSESFHLSEIKRIEDRIADFWEDFEKDHATTVKWLLHDARQASGRLSSFTDDESPFASAESVAIVPGTPIPPGQSKLNIEVHVSRPILFNHLHTQIDPPIVLNNKEENPASIDC